MCVTIRYDRPAVVLQLCVIQSHSGSLGEVPLLQECWTLFTALHGMQTRTTDENSIGLSLCLSNACIVTKRMKDLPDFYTIQKTIYVFWEEEWLVGATPSTWNCGSTGPCWSEIADFEPTFARSASAVTPSEKKFTPIGRPLYALSKEPKMIIVRCPYISKGAQLASRTQNGRFPLKAHLAWRKSATKFFCVKTVSGKVVGHSLA